MGNEGSLPEDAAGMDDAEELEYQAKAPPSATTPPGMPQLPNVHPLQQHQQLSERSGRKLMGSVFTRRGNANNQNGTGIERAQLPLEAAHSYPPSEYTNNGGGISLSGNHNPSIVPMPGEDLTYMSPDPSVSGGYYSNSSYGSNQDANLYRHQQHPPSPQQPLYIQNQQAATTPKQHIIPSQQYYDGQQQQIRPTMQQQQDGEVVGVMYQRPQQGQAAAGGWGAPPPKSARGL